MTHLILFLPFTIIWTQLSLKESAEWTEERVGRYEFWLGFVLFVFAPPLWAVYFCLFVFQFATDYGNGDNWYTDLHPALTAFFYAFYSIGAGNILYQYRDDALLYYNLEEKAEYERELKERAAREKA